MATGQTLVAVWYLLHESNAAHGHGVTIKCVTVRAFDRQVVDAYNQLGIGQGVCGPYSLLCRCHLRLAREVLRGTLFGQSLGSFEG